MANEIKVKIKKVDGLSLAGISNSGNWTMMDTSKDVGGNNGATTPFELLFFALGGCMSMDILSILEKKRNVVDSYQVNIEAQRRDKYPKVADRIDIEFLFWGKINSPDVERAIDLSSSKYCSVSNMLKHEITINYTFKLNPKIK